MIWLFTIFIKGLSRFIIAIPRKGQTLLGATLGLTWFYIVPIRRKTAIENLTTAFPHWDGEKIFSIARLNFVQYGRGFVEFLILPFFSENVFKKIFKVENFEYYKRAVDQNKGVFFLTLHIGSWELMSATSEHLKIPLHVITKKFKTQWLNKIWIQLRLNRGIKLIEEEKSTFQILRAIRKGEVVGFILDQFMGPPVGTRTKFFGHETGTAAALALFADRTRAPVIPVYNIRDKDGRIRIIFEQEIPFMEQGSTEKNISFMTQVYTSKIEKIVSQYPDQWLWIHRRWKPFRE